MHSALLRSTWPQARRQKATRQPWPDADSCSIMAPKVPCHLHRGVSSRGTVVEPSGQGFAETYVHGKVSVITMAPHRILSRVSSSGASAAESSARPKRTTRAQYGRLVGSFARHVAPAPGREPSRSLQASLADYNASCRLVCAMFKEMQSCGGPSFVSRRMQHKTHMQLGWL